VQAHRTIQSAHRHAQDAQTAKDLLATNFEQLSRHAHSCILVLSSSNEQLHARVQFLTKQLLTSVPRRLYNSIVQKCATALSNHRHKMVEGTDVATEAVHDVLDLNRQLADLHSRYCEARKRASAAEMSLSLGDQTCKACQNSGELITLHGKVKQQAVEMQGMQLNVEAAERNSSRIESELCELRQQHVDLQQEHAEQAKSVSVAKSRTVLETCLKMLMDTLGLLTCN
jgi:hypothetical protein